MALKTCAHPKFRHVEPASSVLKVETRDVDVSGLGQAPLDGELVITKGPGEPVGALSDLANSINGNGMNVRMVWGHHLRSDQQSTGRKRVPVFWRGGLDIKLSLYDCEESYKPVAGDHVGIVDMTEAVNGSHARLCARIANNGAAANEWVIGVVTKDASAAAVPVASGTAEALHVRLFDSPMWIKA